MSFGARLAEARKNKGLTQTDLGKGLGTDGVDASKAVVYGWEKDQHFPKVDQLVLICTKLDISADWLLFGRVATAALTPQVARVATEIDRLPEIQRDAVLDVVQTTLHAITQINQVTEKAVTPAPQTGPEQQQSASSIRTKSG